MNSLSVSQTHTHKVLIRTYKTYRESIQTVERELHTGGKQKQTNTKKSAVTKEKPVLFLLFPPSEALLKV